MDNVIGNTHQLIELIFLVLFSRQLHGTVYIRIVARRVQMLVDVCKRL